MRRVIALALCLMLAMALPALAAVDVIKPTSDFYVNDAANVLSDATEGHIVLNNDALYKACGAQLVFVTIDKITSTTIENYTTTLFNSWKIGGSQNNGIVVLMDIGDDDYWILPGKGIQDYITAGDLGEMKDQYLEPAFARKDYDAAARDMFNALFKAVARVYGLSLAVDNSLYDQYVGQFTENTSPGGSPAAPQRASEEKSGGLGGILLLIVVAVVIVLIVRSRRRNAAPRSTPAVSTARQDTTQPLNVPPPTIVNAPRANSGGSQSAYGRGAMGGMLGELMRQGARSGSQTASKPSSGAPSGSSPLYGPSPAGRPSSPSKPATGRTGTTYRSTNTSNLFGGSGLGRSSSSSRSSSGSGFGRSSSSSFRSSSSRSSGFGGGRSGGGGSSRGGGVGRHR